MKIPNKIRKWIIFALGITSLSMGLSLTIWAKIIGVAPWDAFHLGLTNYLPFNLGQITQLVGIVAIIIGMFLGVMPKIGTVLNTIIIGWFINLILNILPNDPFPQVGLLSILVFVIGIIICGIGSGLYISADLGIGPRDSIMVGLNRKFGINVGVARTLMEVLIVILAFLLSGPIGFGTILFSLTIGFFVEKTVKVIKYLNLYQTSQLKEAE